MDYYFVAAAFIASPLSLSLCLRRCLRAACAPLLLTFMISGRDIIFISSIEWDFNWQGHQEIASRLAQAGNRILYIENTGVRSPGLRDASRVASRLRKWTHSLRSRGVRQVAPNIHVCAPLVLPPFGPRWRRQINRRLLLPLVRRAARSLGMRDVLLWTYLPTDTALGLIRLLRTPRSVLLYYCVDNFEQLTPYVHQLKQSEAAVARQSDLMFATCSALSVPRERWHRGIHIFPFGVNLDAFPLDESDGGATASDDSADDLAALPRPVIGYVGGIHRHVDFDLLVALARARPAWSWVYVGPLQAATGELASLPNVHFPGQRPHRELARLIRGFDVCTVPYLSSLYTDSVVPTKINEYLAMGKPVVATDIPAVRAFNEEHDILTVTNNRPENFLRGIEEALQSPAGAATAERRRAVAALADWQARLEAMSDLIEPKLNIKTQRGARRND